jgi:hypothetical protein
LTGRKEGSGPVAERKHYTLLTWLSVANDMACNADEIAVDVDAMAFDADEMAFRC